MRQSFCGRMRLEFLSRRNVIECAEKYGRHAVGCSLDVGLEAALQFDDVGEGSAEGVVHGLGRGSEEQLRTGSGQRGEAARCVDVFLTRGAPLGSTGS